MLSCDVSWCKEKCPYDINALIILFIYKALQSPKASEYLMQYISSNSGSYTTLPLPAQALFKHWMLIFSCRRSYNTPRRADILDTVRYRGIIICLHGLVCYKTNDFQKQTIIYFFLLKETHLAPCTHTPMRLLR